MLPGSSRITVPIGKKNGGAHLYRLFSECNLFKAVASFLIIAFLSPSASTYSPSGEKIGDSVASNFDLIKSVSEQVAEQIVSALPEFARGGLINLVKTKGTGDADFILENAFLELMRQRGYRVCVASKETPCADSSSFSISYQIIRLNIRYPRISRRFWFGSKEVFREARADVIAQLTDRSTGDVIWVREGNARHEDVIPYSLLSFVEEKQYEFTRPPRDEFKISKIVEPAVVAGIVVGLVFLFFSNQSNE